MNEEMPNGQPKIVLETMYEVVKDRYEYMDQYALKLKLQNMQQKAEIEGLKKEIAELRSHIEQSGEAEE